MIQKVFTDQGHRSDISEGMSEMVTLRRKGKEGNSHSLSPCGMRVGMTLSSVSLPNSHLTTLSVCLSDCLSVCMCALCVCMVNIMCCVKVVKFLFLYHIVYLVHSYIVYGSVERLSTLSAM